MFFPAYVVFSIVRSGQDALKNNSFADEGSFYCDEGREETKWNGTKIILRIKMLFYWLQSIKATLLVIFNIDISGFLYQHYIHIGILKHVHKMHYVRIYHHLHARRLVSLVFLFSLSLTICIGPLRPKDKE